MPQDFESLFRNNGKSKEECGDSASLLDAVFEALPDIIFRMDRDGLILEYHAHPTAELYIPPEAFLGKNVKDLMPPDVVQAFMSAIRDAFEQHSLVSFEYSLPMTGRQAYYECRTVAIEATDQVITLIREITLQHEAHEALASSEMNLKTILENAPFPLLISRVRDGSMRYGNKRAQEVFGFRLEEGVGTNAADFYKNPDDRRRFLAALGKHGRVIDQEVEVFDWNGRPYWALLSAAFATFENEPAIVVSINDIDYRKQVEAKLLRQQEELSERLKERECSQAVFEATEDEQLEPRLVFENLLAIIPAGWHYPERCLVRIQWNDISVASEGFRERPSMMTSEASVSEGGPIRLDICYVPSSEPEETDPFFLEERVLASSIVQRLADYLEKRRNSKILHERDNLIALMTDQMAECVALYDPETLLPVLFNRTSHESLGYDKEEFKNITISQLRTEPVHIDRIRHVLLAEHSAPEEFETRHRTKDGRIQDVKVTLRALHYSGKPMLFVIWRDITEEKQKLAEQQFKRERLELYTRLLGEFARDPCLIEGSLKKYISNITEKLSMSLDIPRVAAWFVDGHEEQVRCIDLFMGGEKRHSETEPLRLDQIRPMIDYCTINRYFVLDAERCAGDPAAMAMTGPWIEASKALSSLIVSAVVDGNIIGFLELSYPDRKFVFSRTKVDFACQVADQLAIAYITRQRGEEARARERSEAFLKQAQRVSRTGHWYMDLRSGHIEWSDEMYRIFECDPAKGPGFDDDFSSVHPDDRSRIRAAWKKCIRNGIYSTQHRIFAGNKIKWVEERGEARRDESGDISEVMGITHDVTELVEAQSALDHYRHHLEDLVASRTAELEAARKAAEAASQAKSLFLSNMSHEIRTPMNAVLGFAHLLQSDPLTDKQQGQLARLQDSARKLLQIINDILDISKIEASKMQIGEEEFEPAQVLAYVRDTVSAQAADKRLDFSMEAGDLPRTLRGDAGRLGQILLNLASNAVKFTPQGSVHLCARVLETGKAAAGNDPTVSGSGSPGPKVLIRFEVTDTGIGMTEEQLSRLFNPFEQADSSMTRRFGGTGLGLAISKRLAELMGGRIGVESIPDKGSLFWVEIPFAIVEAAGYADAVKTRKPAAAAVRAGRSHVGESTRTEPAGYREGLRGARVLLVEDNFINQEVASEILRAEGVEVTVAEDGLAAVEFVTKKPFDLVLMDIQMPVMDGLEATRAIRRIPGLEKLPIIAMTANAFESDRQNSLAAGMNDHLPKPVNPEQVYEKLLEWLSS
jgi:PAS domain S-box-containing protein